MRKERDGFWCNTCRRPELLFFTNTYFHGRGGKIPTISCFSARWKVKKRCCNIFFLFLRSSGRVSVSLLIAFYFPLSRTGMTHQNVPLPGREQLRDPAAKPPLEYQSICKAIFFYQHRDFSKAAPTPGECIIAASRAHLQKQHLGGHSRFFSGSPQEGKSCLATVTKKKICPSSAIMSWWSLKFIFAPIFEVRRWHPIRIQFLYSPFTSISLSDIEVDERKARILSLWPVPLYKAAVMNNMWRYNVQ